MRDLVARLIDCGMTRDVALWMLYKYPAQQREEYVESVEAGCEQMEIVE